jgi:hypothetical protein
MNQSKIKNARLIRITEDFIKVALTNDFAYIGVSDYNLANKYRLKGVKQVRFFTGYLAFGYDTLGNKTIVQTNGTIVQLIGV